ncbi:DEAD/DEAH box helicase [Micromonospora sagamiensis]|uniref:ATP-dependent RNA helicase HelY n=1 Tax=Micromonospora sagamiensis TaxID=47875 RepID=A0A562WDG4_9ACTN|nr:SIR2 family protein [Micromonospora sagamiensis]TWJ28333.1 ATP-dependent RNA helicase HelY [Micromonospora sagamiensis]
MDAEQQWLSELSKRAQSKQIALVCGAGVSASISGGVEAATWRGLILSGLQYVSSIDDGLQQMGVAYSQILSDQPSANSYIAVSEWLQRSFETISLGERRAWLASTVGKLRPVDRSLATIFRCRVPILTTNYDDLVEELSGRRSFTWMDRDDIDRYHDTPQDYVFHLHGHHDRPQSVILSGGDYERLASAGLATEVLRALSANHTLVFVGYGAGLEDPHFSAFLDWFNQKFEKTVRRAYVLVRRTEMPAKKLVGRLAYLPYGDEFGDLPGFLRDVLGLDAGADPDVAEDERSTVPPQPVGESDDGLDLPESVQKNMTRQIGARVERGDAQNAMLAAALRALGTRGTSLISAVTGSGKTTVARVAMNLAVNRARSAIMILPTKALVTQEVREWEAWIAAWLEAERKIRVYGSSRDYPEHDSPVSKGRFEIAIAIYEKLAGYLVSGQRTLAGTQLLVVDELQTLVEDKRRAAKLEGLLTMVRLMHPDERPGILGLSATMSEQSTDLLRRWLGVDTFNFIQSSERPVPLDTYVVDANRWRILRDAHLLNLEQSDQAVGPPEDQTHDLGARARGADYGMLQVRGLSTAPLAIALVTRLLTEDPARRILVFVPGRTAAQELASAIQRSLDAALGRCRHRGSPWQVGRFAPDNIDEQTAQSRMLEIKNSDLPLSDDVIRGLRTGVAYHSARLAPKLRRDLEQEFRDPRGILRVLVATDTLAIGVNLPADAVIATSISGYGSDRRRRLSMPSELDNKAGRAGRRGVVQRPRGEFYVLVPSQRDLENVAELTATQIRTLSSLDGVYAHYVIGRQRTPRVSGQIRDLEDVSLLALQVLSADGFGRRPADFEARVASILNALLAAQEPDSRLPSVSEVLEKLRGLKLIGSADAPKQQPTRLGDALARSALSLHSAHILERLARLATEGTGDIDLLFNACRSEEIESVTAWVGLPGVHPRHYPSLKENIQTYAMAYCHEDATRRSYCAQYFGDRRYALPRQFVSEGQAVISKELRGLFERGVEEVEDRDATALLRALVAFEWSRGIPFEQIKARFSAAIRSDEPQRGERPVELNLHYSDIEQLCEQVAGVIRGAASVSFSDSHDWSSRVMLLALQTEVGLPAWLAPIAKLRLDALHRNRLAKLWEVPPVNEGWASILDLPGIADHPAISEAQREVARERLERREREESEFRHMVSREWANVVVPGPDSMTFDDLGEELQAADPAAYVELFAGLGSGLGVDVQTRIDDSHYEARWSVGEESIVVAVPAGELGQEEVDFFANRDALVVLRSRLRPSGLNALARRPTVARFVQPEVILSLIARLVVVRGAGIDPAEVIERLSDLRVSVIDAESHVVVSDRPVSPPPFVGRMPDMTTGPRLSDRQTSEDDAD